MDLALVTVVLLRMVSKERPAGMMVPSRLTTEGSLVSSSSTAWVGAWAGEWGGMGGYG